MKIAILGFGTVGSGVFEILENNKNSIFRRAREAITVKHILDIRDFSGAGHAHLFTKDFEKILNDGEVSVIAETIGGIEPAFTFTKRALERGKSVVTSNKELVATHGAELLGLAAKTGANYLFEASVGGGIPIIRPINRCLAANEVTEIMGILNGTTNYILTKMNRGMTFEEALRKARDKGYAERNPAADIEGHDTCRKIAILSSLVFGKQVDYTHISTEGISGIDLADMKYAGALNAAIKLIGYSRIENGTVFARVSPMLISNENALSKVEDVFNAIQVAGNAVGTVMFYGKGAGKMPTASAVAADIIDIARGISAQGRIMWEQGDSSYIKPIGETVTKCLARVTDAGAALAERVFGGAVPVDAGVPGERGYILPPMREDEVFGKLKAINGVIKVIRVENPC